MSDSEQIVVYQLKIFILGISPMIWRRIKVRSDSTIADLHYIIQGKLNLLSQRLFHCACQAQPTRYFIPITTLLTQRTSPERLYLESKFAALMSYGLSVKLLQEVLPIEGEINTSSILKHHN
jgi:Plasmid pRiA4b ORF-3-like protein